MTNANINSLTLVSTFLGTEKIYTALSPYGSGDDRAMLLSTFLNTKATSSSLSNHINSIQVHTNHNSIFVGTNTGLSGAGDMTSTRTISLDFDSLTAVNSVDPGTAKIPVYDGSHKTIQPYEMWGVLETTDISTTTYSIQNGDFGKRLRFTGTAAQTITIPNDDTLSTPVNAAIMFTNINTNGVNFTGSTSSTVNNVSGFTKSTSIYQMGGLTKDAAQTWIAWGLDA